MWFDALAALADLDAGEKQQFAPPPPATIATAATNTQVPRTFVADVAVVAAPPLQKLKTTPSASDPETYLDYLRANGPATYGAAAVALGWGATRAWTADAQLTAAGLVRHDNLGKLVPLAGGQDAC